MAFLNSLNLTYLIVQCISSIVSVYVPIELILLVWRQYITSAITEQLIYKSKIEKQNVSLDTFVSNTSIARNLHLPGLEKKHFSYKTKCFSFILQKSNDPYSLFGSDIGICVAQSQKTFENQGLTTEVNVFFHTSKIE